MPRLEGGVEAARKLRKELVRLFDFAVKSRMRTTNPAREAGRIKVAAGERSKGFHTWTEAEIETYRAYHKLGTNPRLAMELLLWTGQRRIDGAFLGPDDIRDGRVSVMQSKTGKDLRLPVAPQLTGSRPHWKHTVTTAGRSWWALEMPAAPISVSELGSLAWTPTPRAHKGGLPDSHGWTPTPTGQTGRYRGQIGGGGAGARKRVEELAILWVPTPTAANYGSNVALGPDGKRTGKKRSSLGSLASSVGLSGRQTLAAIYEHMMGFPVGWLSVAGKHMAIPSRPKSRRQLGEQS